MSNPARIEDIMRFMDTDQAAAPAEKTAAVAPPAELSVAMDAVMQSLPGATKTAAATPAPASTPAQDLMKIAEQVAALDREGEIKHAQLLGAAMGDAFVARVGQWEAAAAAVDSPQAKTAAANDQAALAKFAAENPEAFQAAAQQGYLEGKALIEKVGQQVFEQRYQQKVAAIRTTALQHWGHAFKTMDEVGQALAAKQG
jgi:hypothetical protein